MAASRTAPTPNTLTDATCDPRFAKLAINLIYTFVRLRCALRTNRPSPTDEIENNKRIWRRMPKTPKQSVANTALELTVNPVILRHDKFAKNRTRESATNENKNNFFLEFIDVVRQRDIYIYSLFGVGFRRMEFLNSLTQARANGLLTNLNSWTSVDRRAYNNWFITIFTFLIRKSRRLCEKRCSCP